MLTRADHHATVPLVACKCQALVAILSGSGRPDLVAALASLILTTPFIRAPSSTMIDLVSMSPFTIAVPCSSSRSLASMAPSTIPPITTSSAMTLPCTAPPRPRRTWRAPVTDPVDPAVDFHHAGAFDVAGDFHPARDDRHRSVGNRWHHAALPALRLLHPFQRSSSLLPLVMEVRGCPRRPARLPSVSPCSAFAAPARTEFAIASAFSEASRCAGRPARDD